MKVSIKAKDNCLTCDKKFNWHEPVIVKVPECATFCMKCAEKYPDDTVYDRWWLTYQYEPDLTITNE